jgi:hypothetical protein
VHEIQHFLHKPHVVNMWLVQEILSLNFAARKINIISRPELDRVHRYF